MIITVRSILKKLRLLRDIKNLFEHEEEEEEKYCKPVRVNNF